MVHGVFTLVDLAEQRHNQRASRVLQSIEQNLLPIESPMFSCHWPDPVSFAQWGQQFADPAAWLDQIGLIWIVMLLGITIVVVDLNKGFMQHYTPSSVLELLMGEDAAAAAAELLPLITPRFSSSLRVREVAMVYTSLTGHLTPRIEEHLARVYRPVPITNAGCETALKPLSSSRVDRMGAAQVAAHVKAHTEPLHTWYQYITEDSLAANRAAKRRCVADAKAPSCLLVATPINTAASPSLSAATNGADIPSPHPTPAPAHTSTPTSSAITAGAQAVNRRKLQEQHRRQKRAAAELSITMSKRTKAGRANRARGHALAAAAQHQQILMSSAAATEAELAECKNVNMRTATDLQVCQEQLHQSQRALQQSENEVLAVQVSLHRSKAELAAAKEELAACMSKVRSMGTQLAAMRAQLATAKRAMPKDVRDKMSWLQRNEVSLYTLKRWHAMWGAPPCTQAASPATAFKAPPPPCHKERDTVTGAFTAAYACSNAALLTLPNVSCQQLGPLRTAVAAAEFPDAPPQPQAGPSTVRRHQLMLTRKIQGTFKSQLSKAPAVHVQMDGCTIKNGKVVLFCASASIPAPVPSLPTSSLTADPPTPLAAGPPTPLAADPPTPMAAGPPTPLAADPPTPMAAGPPTPLAADPPTPMAAGPPTPLAADPPTPMAAGPPTPLAAGPPTPAQILTHGQEPSKILCRHAKHGHGSKQGLAALLGTVIAKTDPASFRAMDAVDLQPRMKALRKEQRDMERASAAKTAVARAARKAVTESCMVGGNKQLVLNIGTVASLGQLRAASSRHPRGADYSATTLEEAAAFTLAQLWGYINFYKIPPKHRPAQKTLLQNLRRFVKQHIEQRTKAALSSGPGGVA
ncbi:hypothetical protein QJQ45_007170 [Haematococcus lacustris]|nr:hypothetical protein QJQ45_007170 [Haematococcus lacustris]